MPEAESQLLLINLSLWNNVRKTNIKKKKTNSGSIRFYRQYVQSAVKTMTLDFGEMITSYKCALLKHLNVVGINLFLAVL